VRNILAIVAGVIVSLDARYKRLCSFQEGGDCFVIELGEQASSDSEKIHRANFTFVTSF
jgi:hypothetical protein